MFAHKLFSSTLSSSLPPPSPTSYTWNSPTLWFLSPSLTLEPYWRTWLMWRGFSRMWTCSLASPACCPKVPALVGLQPPPQMWHGPLTPPPGAPTRPTSPERRGRTEQREVEGQEEGKGRRKQRTLTLSFQHSYNCGPDCSQFYVGTTGGWDKRGDEIQKWLNGS